MKPSFSSLTKTRSGWTAQDNFDLPNDHQLQVTTYKRSGGLIQTTAMVGRVEHLDGYSMFSYTMGIGKPGDGDFFMRLCSSMARATEKSVAAVHAESLTHMEEILAKVQNHYGSALHVKDPS